VTMAKGGADGRRREVSVITAGHTALQQAHVWQEEIFAELTADWSQQLRDDLQRAMADLIARSQAIST
jgi:DNA-binding MarR family transcriptional regulator